MKVTRNIPSQLILADTPWLIGIGAVCFILLFVGAGLLVMPQSPLGGAAFALMGGGLGLAAFAVFVRRVQVIFDRAAGTILIRRRSLFGSNAMTYGLAELTRAETETIHDSNRRRMYRAALVLDGPSGTDHIPLIQAYASGPSAQRAVKAINDWHRAAGAEAETTA